MKKKYLSTIIATLVVIAGFAVVYASSKTIKYVDIGTTHNVADVPIIPGHNYSLGELEIKEPTHDNSIEIIEAQVVDLSNGFNEEGLVLELDLNKMKIIDYEHRNQLTGEEIAYVSYMHEIWSAWNKTHNIYELYIKDESEDEYNVNAFTFENYYLSCVLNFGHYCNISENITIMYGEEQLSEDYYYFQDDDTLKLYLDISDGLKGIAIIEDEYTDFKLELESILYVNNSEETYEPENYVVTNSLRDLEKMRDGEEVILHPYDNPNIDLCGLEEITTGFDILESLFYDCFNIEELFEYELIETTNSQLEEYDLRIRDFDMRIFAISEMNEENAEMFRAYEGTKRILRFNKYPGETNLLLIYSPYSNEFNILTDINEEIINPNELIVSPDITTSGLMFIIVLSIY